MKRGKYHYDNNFTINPKEYGDLLLYQLGELMCDSSTVIDAHTHLDWFELTYVFSGKGTIYTNNVPAKVRENDVYVSKPKEIHKLVSDSSDPMRYCFVAFNFKKNSPLYDVLTKNNGFALEKTDRVFNMPEFENSFQHLLSYIYNDEDILNNLLLERELESIVLKMLKHIKHNNFNTYSPPKINNIEMLSFNIINYIDIASFTIPSGNTAIPCPSLASETSASLLTDSAKGFTDKCLSARFLESKSRDALPISRSNKGYLISSAKQTDFFISLGEQTAIKRSPPIGVLFR